MERISVGHPIGPSVSELSPVPFFFLVALAGLFMCLEVVNITGHMYIQIVGMCYGLRMHLA